MSHSNSPVVLSQSITKGEELVVVPRKEYEGLLRFYNVQHQQAAKKKRVKRKADGKLTRGLREALADVKAGRVSRAFTDVDEMMKELLS